MSKARNRNLNIVFTSLLSLILIFGAGTWVGYSFTGTTNTFAPGSLETATLNVTGDWYRGATNLTGRLLGIWGALTSTTLDTGQGAYELYGMDQDMLTSSSPTFDDLASTSLDTGHGANELYDMDQNVLTTSSPTFDALITATLDTGQGANELYDMDQNVLTSSSPTFENLTIDGIDVEWVDLGGVNRTTWPTGGSGTDGRGSYDYIIYLDGANAVAENATGSIEASSATHDTVFNYVAINMGAGKGYVSTGTYTMTDSWYPRDMQTWWGAGKEATILVAGTNLNKPVVQVGNHSGDIQVRIDIGYMKIDGNKANQDGSTPLKTSPLAGYGIVQLGKVEKSVFHDMWITESDCDGLRIIGNNATQTYGINEFYGLHIINSARFGIFNTYDIDQKFHTWIWVQSSGSDNFNLRRACTMEGAHSVYAGANGFTIEGGADMQFSDCYADNAQNHGWYVNGPNNQFANCKAFDCGQAINNTYSGWFFDNGGDYSSNVGIFSDGNNQQKYGVQVNTGCNNVTLAGGRIWDNITADIIDANANTMIWGVSGATNKN